MHPRLGAFRRAMLDMAPWLIGIPLGLAAFAGWWSNASHRCPRPSVQVIALPSAPVVVDVDVDGAHVATPVERRASPRRAARRRHEPRQLRPVATRDTSVICPGAGECAIDRELFEELMGRPARVFRQMRIVPTIRDGKPVGVKLFGMRADHPLRRLGLRNGDVLERVNGHPATSPLEVVGLFAMSSRAAPLTVSIERAGEQLVKRYRIA